MLSGTFIREDLVKFTGGTDKGNKPIATFANCRMIGSASPYNIVSANSTGA